MREIPGYVQGNLMEIVHYRHPGLRRGEPNVRVRAAGRGPFLVDPVDPRSNYGRLPNRVKHTDFDMFSPKMDFRIGSAPRRCPRALKGSLGALTALSQITFAHSM